MLATILDGLDQGGAPRLAFKGGASMEIRFGVAARASRDVDALVNVSLDDAFAEIGARLNAGWEGFTGKLTERTDITRAGITPAPQRCKIKLAYHYRPFATLAFELSRAEANSFELLEQIPNAVDLDRVQLGPAGDVVVLSVHYQIAQKLHACTEVPAEGSNQRVHDIYDTDQARQTRSLSFIHASNSSPSDGIRPSGALVGPPSACQSPTAVSNPETSLAVRTKAGRTRSVPSR